MLLLLIALQVTAPAATDSIPRGDSIPRITLGEAIRRSARLDPDYVQALGQIENAEWGRRAAMLAFFVPSVDLGLDETKYSQEFLPGCARRPTSCAGGGPSSGTGRRGRARRRRTGRG